nr:hypothetical protein [Rhizobium leguminosarum]
MLARDGARYRQSEPMPPVSLDRDISKRKNGANTFSFIASGIPGPQSSTTISNGIPMPNENRRH